MAMRQISEIIAEGRHRGGVFHKSRTAAWYDRRGPNYVSLGTLLREGFQGPFSFLNHQSHQNVKAPYVNFRELKSQVSIRQILDRYELAPDMKAIGDALSGSCPLCESQSRNCFRVSQSKNCFMCFSCQTGGNILDFVGAMEDCSIRDAAVMIAGWFEIEHQKPARSRKSKAGEAPRSKAPGKREPSTPKLKEESPPSKGESNSTPSAVNAPLSFELKLDPNHPWFDSAGIKPETVKEFGLGFCSKGVMGGRIAFPIRNRDGDLIGYAGCWPAKIAPEGQPTWKYPKDLDLDQIIFPADKLGECDLATSLLAMDPLQVVIAWQLGIENVAHFPGNHPKPDSMRTISIALD